MTVFKTFLKILNKNKWLLILYVAILALFGNVNLESNSNGMEFVETKPNIAILNYDNDVISNDIVRYLTEKNKVVELKDDESVRSDALFYREVSVIYTIKEGFSKDFMNGLNPKIEKKASGDYTATFADMNLTKYLKILNVYKDEFDSQEDLINKVNSTLVDDVKVKINSKVDNSKMSRVGIYYCFANYSILASVVYVISVVLSSFRDKNIMKRTIISSSDYKKVNRELLLATSLFSLVVCALYIVISIVEIGPDALFTINGIFCMLSMFVFTICATTIALLIGNLVSNKEAISGVINVIALGSSFLCGAFVPLSYLPESVKTIAHALPSYFYVSAVDNATKLETLSLESLTPLLVNYGIIIGFSVLFMVITNYISKKKMIIG